MSETVAACGAIFNGRAVSTDPVSAQIVQNVYAYFYSSNANASPSTALQGGSAVTSTASATLLSPNTIRKCLDADVKQLLKSQQETRTAPRINFADAELDFADPEVSLVCTVVEAEIRRRKEKGEHVSLRILSTFLFEQGYHGWDRSKVFRLLRHRGWRYGKTNGYVYLSQKPEVISKTSQFLNAKYQLEEEGAVFVFIDETYLWMDTQSACTWFRANEKDSWLATKSSEGKRFIVIGAGCAELGWLPDCLLVLEANSNDLDYHNALNAQHFANWFKVHVFVMPQCSYVCQSLLIPAIKTPTSGNRIRQCLLSRSVLRRLWCIVQDETQCAGCVFATLRGAARLGGI